jgi:hypothetical protein
MRPVSSDLYIDAALSAFSLKYKNAKYIKDDLFPKVTVNKDTGNYYEFGTQHLRKRNAEWDESGRAKQMEWTISSTGSYTLKAYALEGFIKWKERDNADNVVRYESNCSNMTLDALELDEEIAVADLMTATSSYSSTSYYKDYSSDSDAIWSNTSNSDPLFDILSAKDTIADAIIDEPNIFWCSRKVMTVLRMHPKLTKYFINTEGGLLTLNQLKSLLEVDKILVAPSMYVNSEEGATTETRTLCWGRNAGLVYVPATPALEQMSWGYNIVKTKHPYVERWSEQPEHRDVVRPVKKYEKKIVNSTAGYLFNNCVSA